MQLIQLMSVFTVWSTGLFFVIKYIGKKVVDRTFERDTIRFKSELDKDLKLFDANLHETTIKYQIQYSTIHSNTATVITELYKLIINLEYSVGDYMRNNGKPEFSKKMYEDLNALKRKHYETDIYFSDQLNAKFMTIINAFVGVYADFDTYLAYGEYNELDKDLKIEKREMKNAAADGISKKIPQIKADLKKEYQAILGITFKTTTNEHDN